jgi:hypothetical protein
MKTKPIAVQLETCHANHDGTAWYAYYPAEGDPDTSLDVVQALSEADGAPLGLEREYGEPEQVDSRLSLAAGLRRFWVGGAV